MELLGCSKDVAVWLSTPWGQPMAYNQCERLEQYIELARQGSRQADHAKDRRPGHAWTLQLDTHGQECSCSVVQFTDSFLVVKVGHGGELGALLTQATCPLCMLVMTDRRRVLQQTVHTPQWCQQQLLIHTV